MMATNTYGEIRKRLLRDLDYELNAMDEYVDKLLEEIDTLKDRIQELEGELESEIQQKEEIAEYEAELKQSFGQALENNIKPERRLFG